LLSPSASGKKKQENSEICYEAFRTNKEKENYIKLNNFLQDHEILQKEIVMRSSSSHANQSIEEPHSRASSKNKSL
jgi:hypothetical protein